MGGGKERNGDAEMIVGIVEELMHSADEQDNHNLWNQTTLGQGCLCSKLRESAVEVRRDD